LAVLAFGKAEAARAYLEETCAAAVAEGYSGDYPEQEIWWASYQVCRACGETVRAQLALDRAHRLVQQQAARIGDPSRRQSFLERIPVNREIERAWNEDVGAQRTAPPRP
jgi:hypothetical protein